MDVKNLLIITGSLLALVLVAAVVVRRRGSSRKAAPHAEVPATTGWVAPQQVRYSSIDAALQAGGCLAVDYSAVQGLLTKLHPTAAQANLSGVANALCRAAFIFGIQGVEQDMRAVVDHAKRVMAATELFAEFPYLKVMETVDGERGKMVRVTLRNELENHVLECWAEWRSTTLGEPVVVLLITPGNN